MKHLTTISILILASLCISAQGSTLSLKGCLKTEQQLLSYDVLLLKDSAAVAGNSFTTPEFELVLQKTGQYTLVISSAQFNTVKREITVMASETNLGAIPVAQNEIKGAVVSATKPTFRQDGPDKLTVNVEGSPLATHGDALTVLGRIPGVNADKESGAVNLLDGSAVTLFLNGQRIKDPTMLQSIQAGDITSVVVDKSPSAAYEGTTQGGIYITTKKQHGNHFTASVGNEAGWGRKFGDQLPLALGLRTGKVSQYLSVTPQGGKYIQYDATSETVLRENASDTLLHSIKDRDNNGQIGSLDIFYMLSIEPDSLTTCGIQYTGALRHAKSTMHVNEHLNGTQELFEYYDGKNGNRHNISLNFARQLNTKSLFALVGDFGTSHSGQSDIVGESAPMTTQSHNHYHVYGLDADYAWRGEKGLQIKAGGFFSMVTDKAEGSYASFSTAYRTKEQIWGFHATVAKSFWACDWSVGLRGEWSRMHLVYENGAGTPISYPLFRALPTVKVARTFGREASLSASFSQSVERPNFTNLSPEMTYYDQVSYSQGNPELKPQTNSRIRLAGQWKGLSLTLSYWDIADADIALPLWDASLQKIRFTNMNMGHWRQVSAWLEYSLQAGNFEGMASIYAQKPFFSWEFQGQTLQRDKIATELETQLSYGFAHWAKLTLEYCFRANAGYGLYVFTKPTHNLGVEFSGEVLKGKLEYSVSVTDILKKVRFNTWRQAYRNIICTMDSDGDTRMAYLTLRFHFGKAKVNVERKSANQEALGRL